MLFARNCNDLVAWCDEVAAQLGSDDNGSDLSSCKMLLLRHEALSRQIGSQRERVNEIENTLKSSQENFMVAKMNEAADMVCPLNIVCTCWSGLGGSWKGLLRIEFSDLSIIRSQSMNMCVCKSHNFTLLYQIK